jgi:CheY-like chemotaxis protein
MSAIRTHASAQGPPLVLVVDDNPDTLEMYALGLEYEGLRVSSAPDGERALLAVLHELPDCIVTDVRMPRMNGMEFRRALQQQPATSDIPMIALTAMGSPRELDTARAAGFETILVKPCLPDYLAREIVRVVTASRAARAAIVQARSQHIAGKHGLSRKPRKPRP